MVVEKTTIVVQAPVKIFLKKQRNKHKSEEIIECFYLAVLIQRQFQWAFVSAQE